MLSNVRRGEGRGGNLIRVAREGGGEGGGGVGGLGYKKNPQNQNRGLFREGD